MLTNWEFFAKKSHPREIMKYLLLFIIFAKIEMFTIGGGYTSLTAFVRQ